MKIYTKTGDLGKTGLITKRLSKSEKVFVFLGNLDELNANIAFLNSTIPFELLSYKEKLISIQNLIFSLGAIISGANLKLDLNKETSLLEKEIDNMTKDLPELKNFILPGGGMFTSQIHIVRAITRKTERSFFNLRDFKNYSEIGKYLNRLSDWFFTFARYSGKLLHEEEKLWKA